MSDDERHRALCAEHSALIATKYDRTPPSLTPEEQARLDVINEETDRIECAKLAPDFARLEALAKRAEKLADDMRATLAELERVTRPTR